MPFVKLDTTIGDDAPEFEPAAPPSLDVHEAVNPVIALPLSPCATNATEICALPRVTVGFKVVSGTAAGTVEADATELLPVPFPFVALTVQV